jgi:hypothetical protein
VIYQLTPKGAMSEPALTAHWHYIWSSKGSPHNYGLAVGHTYVKTFFAGSNQPNQDKLTAPDIEEIQSGSSGSVDIGKSGLSELGQERGIDSDMEVDSDAKSEDSDNMSEGSDVDDQEYENFSNINEDLEEQIFMDMM